MQTTCRISVGIMERKEWKKLFSYATYPAVFPVIHVQSAGQAIANITRIRDQAIAGVSLQKYKGISTVTCTVRAVKTISSYIILLLN